MEDLEDISEYCQILGAYFKAVCAEYTYILHCSDAPEAETSEDMPALEKFYFEQGVKIPHVHFVFRAFERTRLSSWIIRIADVLGFGKDQRILVSVENCRCFPYAIQYLLHLNHAEKYQYPRDALITNLTRDQIDFYLQSDGTYLDPHTLLDLVRSSNSLTEIIMRLGLETYNRYRIVITTMFYETKNNPYLYGELDRPLAIERKEAAR